VEILCIEHDVSDIRLQWFFFDKIFHFFNPQNWGEFGSFCCFKWVVFAKKNYITKLKRKTLLSTSFLKKKGKIKETNILFVKSKRCQQPNYTTSLF
jgi:hypothetical protein